MTTTHGNCDHIIVVNIHTCIFIVNIHTYIFTNEKVDKMQLTASESMALVVRDTTQTEQHLSMLK